MTPPPLLAAVFDYGGVITQPMSAIQGEVPSGVDPAKLRAALDTVMAHGDPGSPWAQVERGEISLAAFAAVVDS